MKGSLRALGLIFVSASFLPNWAEGQERDSVITGTVVNELNRALPDVQVYIENPPLGVLTNEAGRFKLEHVPPGSHQVLAALIGYRRNWTVAEVAEGDSADVTLELEQHDIRISGTDWDYPPPDRLTAAQGLLPGVLSDSLFIETIEEIWPGVAITDTITVWAAWLSAEPDSAVGSGPFFRLMRECPDCVESVGFTVEGGDAYTSGNRHVSLGLREGDVESRSIAFCISFVEKRDFLLKNCGGLGERSRLASYGQSPRGDWIRLDWW